ncbi:4-hydroxy-3-methylbut-2-enyl diphosphate reductase [Candidatus Venteria ishoeyi]|uniref:4-hydroxy-3-methylbut-2-enyl diphosphate reductase n=1 Tax=Candidatus Venteria ishoeyi TaxID=1899563 RepID=A0A1H6F8W2_9GAMM|nr:4-hydroxy-3-methylbut-2-enyl diphosphate reductase [Candidatus Venteria ishoeyi]SEH05464.1 4-hydroxy-3-methylbut-2-enyl diphosphate reductase [Candidatus Venteria ishoeyi]
MIVEIEGSSGFCFGVHKAVEKAEEILQSEEKLYCLGDIVHNGQEISRLEKLGLITIDHHQFKTLKNCKVLLRAHGEPPSTYLLAAENNIELIDATCPIVLSLQKKIQKTYQDSLKDNQVVIYGKAAHPEVISLIGQTNKQAKIIEDISEIDKIDFSKPISLYAQTTMDTAKYKELENEIQNRKIGNLKLTTVNSICGAVSGREDKLNEFAGTKEIVVFVAGKKSSNGKMLFEICKEANPNSYYISNPDELNNAWFYNMEFVGICGATSTPQWLLNHVADKIREIYAASNF